MDDIKENPWISTQKEMEELSAQIEEMIKTIEEINSEYELIHRWNRQANTCSKVAIAIAILAIIIRIAAAL